MRPIKVRIRDFPFALTTAFGDKQDILDNLSDQDFLLGCLEDSRHPLTGTYPVICKRGHGRYIVVCELADLGVCWDNVICAKNKIDLGNFSLILGSGNKLKSSDNRHRPIGNRVQIVCSGFDVA